MDASLPDEIWRTILSNQCLTIRDLAFISLVSKRFRDLAGEGGLWRKKFIQRWSTIYKNHRDELEKTVSTNERENKWKKNCRTKLESIKFVVAEIEKLSKIFVRKDSVYLSYSVFRDIEAGFSQSGLFWVVDSLREVLAVKENRDRDLTHCFYASQALRTVLHNQLTRLILEWTQNPFPLEKGAYLFALWFQPDLEISSYEEFELMLDGYAEEVKSVLLQKHPHHPAASTSFEWPNGRTESKWDPDNNRKVLDALNYIFVRDFTGDSEDYYHEENSFINKTRNRGKGIPVTLLILYHSIARRLGVYCLPIGFPCHMMLKFMEHPELGESQKWTYIDPFNGCLMMSQGEMWQRRTGAHGQHFVWNPDFVQPISNLAVLTRMCNNFCMIHQRYVRRPPETMLGARELSLLLNPSDVNIRMHLAKSYLQLDFNFSHAIEILTKIEVPEADPHMSIQKTYWIQMAETALDHDRNSAQGAFVVKKASDEKYKHVKFSVGLIMRHKKYDYTCVITGWDEKCGAQQSWQNQMGVPNLSRQDQQPFYNVLVNDGSNRYAAEENMLVERNLAEVTHPEIGKFFNRFCGTHYEMNPEKLVEYPEDAERSREYVAQNYPLQQ